MHTLGSADSLLNNGEMRRFELDGKAIVLARVDNNYYAFQASCTHYGGPLDKGVLQGHTVMCPWHHACFDIRNGLRLEPPALNNLPHYPVKIENGQVMVDMENAAREPIPPAEAGTRTFVIIGGGAAGNAAVEELCRQGFAGQIMLISATPLPPIDRPNVSKDYLSGSAKAEWMPLRGEKWYAEHLVGLRLNTRVTEIIPDDHEIMLDGQEAITYDKLLIATGGQPRMLNIPGKDLEGIFLLREQSDADRIIAADGEGKRAVVIGASFIGMEVAYSLGQRNVDVTVVGLEDVPFEHILGREIGQVFQQEHESNGVKFRLSSGVEQFIGENGQVTGVQIKGGEILLADFVVVGVGVQPRTNFLENSGISLHERDRSVLVNEYLQTSLPNIYAAGDIARYPDGNGGTVRIEHWRVAQQHGIVAAINMLGKNESIHTRVPFFWTKQWGLSLRYVGHAEKWDEIIFRGDVAAKEFIAFYVKDGKMLAAAGCKRDTELDAIEFLMKNGRELSPSQMRDPNFDLIAYATR